MNLPLIKLIPSFLLALSLMGCSAVQSVVGVETDLAPIAASDDRKCRALPAAPKQMRPAPGKWDLKVAVGRIHTLGRLYNQCADLQERNLTQLRGDRKK